MQKIVWKVKEFSLRLISSVYDYRYVKEMEMIKDTKGGYKFPYQQNTVRFKVLGGVNEAINPITNISARRL